MSELMDASVLPLSSWFCPETFLKNYTIRSAKKALTPLSRPTMEVSDAEIKAIIDRFADHHIDGANVFELKQLSVKRVVDSKEATMAHEDILSPTNKTYDLFDSPLMQIDDDEVGEVTLSSTSMTNNPLPTPPESPTNLKTLGGDGRDLFRNEYFVVQSSPVAGFGAFAAKELKYGECILLERPLLRTTAQNLFRDFEALDEDDKKVYMSLHGFSLKKDAHVVEKIRRSNGFSVPGGFGIFAIASRFNHACRPVCNVHYRFDQTHNAIKLTVAQDRIPEGTELLLNYGGTPSQLYSTFGFRCQCGGCASLSDKEVFFIAERSWSRGSW